MTTQSRIDVPAAKMIADGAGRSIAFPLHPISQLVAGADLAANVSLFDMTLPPKSPGAPPHTHTHEDEIYHVLSGELTFLLGEEVAVAPAGATVVLPRGQMHATWNAHDGPTRALTFVSQDSEFEHFFDAVAARIAQEGIADPMAAAGVVGEIAAGIGVAIDMTALPDEAKPYFGMA